MRSQVKAANYSARIDVTDRNGNRHEMFNISSGSHIDALKQRQEIHDKMIAKYGASEVYIFTNWSA